jgi:16S rRNA (uracil1498-N3)-methyltransferase
VTTILLAPGSLVVRERIALPAEEQHHLAVRRAREGEPVTALDGAGHRGMGRLVADGDQLAVVLDRVSLVPRPPECTLAVGAGDKDRFGLIAEQAVQLGATRLIPLETERTTGVATRLRDGQLDRLRRRAREALKQCEAAWAPEILAPMPLEELLGSVRDGARWLADHAGEGGAPRLGAADPLAVLVGPEGGFTAGERDRILGLGWTPVALGPHILRFETAALAALSAAWQARQRGTHG